jgi:hypothetical protein
LLENVLVLFKLQNRLPVSYFSEKGFGIEGGLGFLSHVSFFPDEKPRTGAFKIAIKL